MTTNRPQGLTIGISIWKVLFWSILSLGLIAFVLVVLFFTVECTYTSVGDVRTKIERDLPLGTPANEILPWLQQNDIEFFSEGPVGRYPSLQERGLSPATYVIRAGIANTGEGPGLTMKHIDIFFLLRAENGRLKEVIVEEVSISI